MSTSAKRKQTDVDERDQMTITPLGGGSEVGRSCILIEYKNKRVLLDCGIHPAYTGLASLPFFDEIDPATIDVLLVSHFHLDHAAAVPYFMEKTTFKGRVFMTHPTKAIYKWLLSDFIRVTSMGEDMLFSEQDLLNSYERIEAVDFHQQVEVDQIRFTSYNAGHVLGAAMFVIEIAGIKVLYTGDYSREEDRHLMAAERPPGLVPDVMICEATYGVHSNEPRISREARFTSLVHDAVAGGGRCLIPAFSLGRAQELLLIMDEYWQAHPELHPVPIYYASALAKKCMAVYQTYVNMMNQRIRKQIAHNNPFVFKHISNLKNIDMFDDNGPCVMMASPAMLQSGLSRDLFERWCSDKKNACIIPGYVVEGTLAKQILSEPDEVTALDGRKLPLRMKIDYISFSAHVDYTQNSEFIDEMKPVNLVLVHGEANEMHRLRQALHDKYADKPDPVKIYTPRNTDNLHLYFRGEKIAKTIGTLARESETMTQDSPIEGLLIGKDFQYNIISPADLPEYTDLKNTQIQQKMCLRFTAPFALLQFHIDQMFGQSETYERESLVGREECLRVMDSVTIVRKEKERQLLLEWTSTNVNDMMADSVVALILEIESHPASVKMTKSKCSHSRGHLEPHQEYDFVRDKLRSHFDETHIHEHANGEHYDESEGKAQYLDLNIDGAAVSVDLEQLEVIAENAEIQSRVNQVLQECSIALSAL